MHISRINNHGKVYIDTNSQSWSTLKKADITAYHANASIEEIANKFPETIYKKTAL